MSKSLYSNQYYSRITDDSVSSAKAIVPIILDLVSPSSVLDIGCGSGAFLSVFKDQGVKEIQGVDGDWVTKESLLIPMENFRSANLRNSLELEKKFDLVMTVEVAEHVEEEHAETFVDNLTRHGDVVMFSAAIPDQGGTYHVNEQWQSYWAEKFAKRGYLAFDPIRNAVWADKNVAYYYAQNVLVFVKKEALSKTKLKEADVVHDLESLNLVHPVTYEEKARKANRYDKIANLVPYKLKKGLLKLKKR